MKRGKAIAAAAACAALAMTKMLLPDVGESVRERLRVTLARDGDYAAVFRELGSRLDLRRVDRAAAPRTTDASETALPTPGAQYISYLIEESAASGETDRPEPTALPAAVAAFLESQAVFSDQTLPQNVDYGYTDIPFDFALPVAGRQSSGFGFRLHPILHTVRFHYGTDVAAPAGESIAAFADGTVILAGYDESFGWHLKIDHGGGWVSHYCHCSALLAEKGDRVTMGQTVAKVGQTGLATGPHLHFELTRDGVYLNPEYYLCA